MEPRAGLACSLSTGSIGRISLSALCACACCLCFFSGAPDADAHLVGKLKGKTIRMIIKYQKEQYAHSRYVCVRGTGEPKRWHCAASKWIAHELKKTLAQLAPPRPAVDSCLHELLMREGGYNPHKWNGGYVGPWDPYSTHGGSGAYGGPQALPGSKMASAGPDWRDNIWTQIRWMIGYVNGRYGGSCSALAFQRANGYY